MKNCVKYIVFVLGFALVGPESRADNYFPSDDLLYAINDWVANVFHRYKYPGLLFEQPSKFIEPFDQGLGLDKYANLTYRKVFSADVSTALGATYRVDGFRLDGYGWDGEPGDYHLIKIEKDGNKIFEQICILGWIYFPDDLPSSNVADRRFFVYPLKDNSLALFFCGTIISSLPPQLTIVCVQENKATLVFNKLSYMNKIERNGDEINFTLQSNTLEYLDSDTPINSPDLHTLTLRDGMIYYK